MASFLLPQPRDKVTRAGSSEYRALCQPQAFLRKRLGSSVQVWKGPARELEEESLGSKTKIPKEPKVSKSLRVFSSERPGVLRIRLQVVISVTLGW